jgi:hypothetical protein
LSTSSIRAFERSSSRLLTALRTSVKCRVFCRCELAQCRSQEGVFKSWVSVDIQAKILTLIRRSKQEFLKIENEPSMLHLKEKTASSYSAFVPAHLVENNDSLYRRGRLLFVMIIRETVNTLDKCLHCCLSCSTSPSIPGNLSPANVIADQCLSQDPHEWSISR